MKILRWILRIFTVIILVAIVVIILKFQFLSKAAIQHQLETIFREAGLSAQSITYDRLIIQPFNKKIILDSVLFNPDKNLRQILKNPPENMVFTLLGKADMITVGGWNIRRSIKDHKLVFSYFYLESPNIQIITRIADSTLRADEPPSPPMGKIRSVEVDNMEVLNGNFIWYDIIKGFDYQIKIDTLNCFVKKIKIDTAWLDTPIPVRFDHFNLKASGCYTNILKNFSVNSRQVLINSKDKLVFADNITIRPHHIIKTSKDGSSAAGSLNLSNQELIITGIDLKALYYDKTFIANRIECNGLETVYHDYSVDGGEEDTVILSINEKIRSLPVKVSVDSLKITGSRFVILEQPVHTSPPAIMKLSDIGFVAVNITNDSRKLRRDPSLKIFFSGLLMEEGQMDVEADLNIRDPDDKIYISGKLGSMEATSLNSMSENLGLVRINSGKIDSLIFNFSADKDSSSGRLDLVYHDLRLQVLKESGNDYRLRKKHRIFTFLANNVIKNQNDPEKLNYRSADLRYIRKAGEDYYEYILNAVTEGIVSNFAPVIDDKE